MLMRASHTKPGGGRGDLLYRAKGPPVVRRIEQEISRVLDAHRSNRRSVVAEHRAEITLYWRGEIRQLGERQRCCGMITRLPLQFTHHPGSLFIPTSCGDCECADSCGDDESQNDEPNPHAS
jgi:hypothetical protein